MASRSYVQKKASDASPAPQHFSKSRLFSTPSQATADQATLEQQVQLEKAQHFHQNFANIPLAPRESFPSSIQPKFTIGAQRSKSEPEADRLTKQEMQHLNTNTAGRDVLFPEGAYQPGSRGGQELIAHELTHVVQQMERKLVDPLGSRPNSENEKINRWPTDQKNNESAKLLLEAVNEVSRLNYTVANKLGDKTYNTLTDTDTYEAQGKARVKRKKELIQSGMNEINAGIKQDSGDFTLYFGQELNQEVEKKQMKLVCAAFHAAMLAKLVEKGFPRESIKKGQLGLNVMAGHVFTVVYPGTDDARYIDFWAAKQKGPNECPIVSPSDYVNWLPNPDDQGLTESTRQCRITLKNSAGKVKLSSA